LVEQAVSIILKTQEFSDGHGRFAASLLVQLVFFHDCNMKIPPTNLNYEEGTSMCWSMWNSRGMD
jgi:hypothetical protein